MPGVTATATANSSRTTQTCRAAAVLAPSDADLRVMFRGMRGVDLAALGIPTEAQFVAAYARRTGRTAVPDLEFYVADSIKRGIEMARESIDSGAARGKLDEFVRYTQRFSA